MIEPVCPGLLRVRPTWPKRIQRKRLKGWRMPRGALYVGRPTKWGNPFRPTDPDALKLYQARLVQEVLAGNLDLRELRGRDLACWCPLGRPCHADILIAFTNV